MAANRLLARAFAGEEVLGLAEDSARARVRTYGPILVEGAVPRDALGPRERKEVASPLGAQVTWEAAMDAALLAEPNGRILGTVRGGTPIALDEDHGDIVKVVTAGDVRTRAWMLRRALTRLAPVEEMLK